MFPDLIIPAQDFEQQLGACVNAMCHDDGAGRFSGGGAARKRGCQPS